MGFVEDPRTNTVFDLLDCRSVLWVFPSRIGSNHEYDAEQHFINIDARRTVRNAYYA